MNKSSGHLYDFGQFRLDSGERLLLRDGGIVPLTPKSFDVLLTLVENHGRLMEKDFLLKTVWADAIVEENNLADNISRLRKALGEGEQGQRFIETVPKRGYRFVAEVRSTNGIQPEPVRNPPAPAAARSGRWGPAITGAALVAGVIIGYLAGIRQSRPEVGSQPVHVGFGS